MIETSGKQEIGLILDGDEAEYPFWALLQQRNPGRTFHLRHVSILTPFSPKADPTPPEAVIVATSRPDALLGLGPSFRALKPASRVRVFINGEDLGH